MINQGEFLPKQMNGIVVNSFAQSLDDEFSASEKICDYLHNLSIETANETELDSIGYIIGYPRPLVPQGFAEENLLILGNIPLQTDIKNGLAKAGQSVGGLLTTALPTIDSYKLDSGLYRKFLERIAIIKRYGITLSSIDGIASLINKDYEIYFDKNSDIVINYNKPIGYKNVWILTNLFYSFCTIPQVIVTTGANNDKNSRNG